MSIDFSAAGPQHNMFGQPDIDQPYSPLQGGDLHSGSHLPVNGHPLDRSDSLDVGDHYDIFSSAAQGSLASQRYRTNASSSSSLGPSYALGVDPLYPPSPFGDNLPSFHNNNSYDLIGGLSSSYSSGKPSPITPNDVGGLPHGGFPFSNGQSKEFPGHPNFHDPLLERRMSGMNGSGYSSDFNNDDYNPMGVSPSLGMNGFHTPTALQYDRLGRVPNDARYSNSNMSHMQSHGPELIRGVAPQATHYRTDSSLPPFDDMQFMPNPQVDYPLRLPSGVDGDMARLRLQGAGDLQTFIR